MSDLFHIHLPCQDADIKALEQALGVKFVPVYPSMVPSESVEVCPMTPGMADALLEFAICAELIYEQKRSKTS